MEKSIQLDLREIILNSLNTSQMEALGKELDNAYNPHKLANLPFGARLRDRNQGAKLLVDFAARNNKLEKLIVEFIETDGKTLAGKKVNIEGLEGFLSKLPHFGIVYNRVKGVLEDFQGSPEELDNWGVLKEGETYELAFISIDIAGNSVLQEKYEKEHIEIAYKNFMKYIRAILDRFRGKVWNWAGDGGLCAFYLDNKAQDAAKAAVSILTGMIIFNSDENNLPEPINIRIAVDRGNAVYKNDKGNIYSETVNWVCHLEKNGTDINSISISQEVYEALDDYMKEFFIKSGKFEEKIAYKFTFGDKIGSKSKKGLFG